VRIGSTVLALLVACAARDNAQPSPAGPGRIVLIRHGEQPSNVADPHLSKDGRVRAKAFVEFMTHDPAMLRLGTPAAIFATATT